MQPAHCYSTDLELPGPAFAPDGPDMVSQDHASLGKMHADVGHGRDVWGGEAPAAQAAKAAAKVRRSAPVMTPKLP